MKIHLVVLTEVHNIGDEILGVSFSLNKILGVSNIQGLARLSKMICRLKAQGTTKGLTKIGRHRLARP
jgi:hypothetical protein